MTNSDRIVAAAKEILAAHPQGLRHSELAPAIQDKLKDIPKNSIWTTTSSLNRLTPEILKVARGFFQLRSVTEEEAAALPIVEAEPPREANFYEPFADWLAPAPGPSDCILHSRQSMTRGSATYRIGFETHSCTDDLGGFQPTCGETLHHIRRFKRTFESKDYTLEIIVGNRPEVVAARYLA